MSFEIVTPPDWRRSSVSKYCHVQLGKMLQSDPSGEDDELLPYLRAINIAKGGVNLSHQFSMWIKPHEREKFRLRPEDVLVSEGGDAGRTAHFTDDGEYYFQNAINRVRPIDHHSVSSRYIYYWFTFLKLAGYVDLICNIATIAHFTAEKVKASPFALPSLETQKRIAAFLDEKTAQIDSLIARKQELLERLAEKRQAIITQAVTKGLNPAAPMKDSGIDWLGQIPAHWELKRLRFFIEANPVKSQVKLPGETEVSFLPMDSLGEMGGMALDQSRALDEVYTGYTYFAENDVCVAKITPCFENYKGSIAPSLLNGVGFGTTELHVLRSQGKIVPQFLFLLTLTHSFRGFGTAQMLGAGGQKRVPERFIKDWPTPLPPIDEQLEILALVQSRLDEIDTSLRTVEASIEALTEYRAALITSAVTGQIEGLR